MIISIQTKKTHLKGIHPLTFYLGVWLFPS